MGTGRRRTDAGDPGGPCKLAAHECGDHQLTRVCRVEGQGTDRHGPGAREGERIVDRDRRECVGDLVERDPSGNP